MSFPLLAFVSQAVVALWALFSSVALTENNLTLLLVAAIGAGASLTSVWITSRTQRELRQVRRDRRLVVTKAENGVTFSDEEIDDLADPDLK
jgi:hypothetical protein